MSQLARTILNGEHLVTALLREQETLSAVETFARRDELGEIREQGESRFYGDRIPVSAPQAHQQLAFEVDLDRCSGCKSCVVACHHRNGLDEEETWRSVGLLRGGSVFEPAVRSVTTACHHCLEPACATGCPVLAYEKDSITGIVHHLDDQCIGCEYCVLMCPYGVPQFNERLAIVRKCDMCAQRLAVGEEPACVNACPTEAIRITLVDREEIRTEAKAGTFLVGAAEPSVTCPTTRYVSSEESLRNLKPANLGSIQTAKPHRPLSFFLVLSQVACGASLVAAGAQLIGRTQLSQLIARFAALLAITSVAVSTTHLGRPKFAFRAILGVRRSWLSREIACFGGYTMLAATAALANLNPYAADILHIATALTGLAAVATSVMVYSATKRPQWRLPRTAWRFSLTVVASALLIALLSTTAMRSLAAAHDIAIFFAFASAAKLFLDALTTQHAWCDGDGPDVLTARLLRTPLRRPVLARVTSGLCAWACAWGVVVTLSIGTPAELPLAFACAASALWLLQELIERDIFFRAVPTNGMPGARI